VKTVVATAENGGAAIKRPWLGAELQDVSPDIATSLGMARPEGALIVSLHPDSPLAKAGLKRGDIVLALEGKPVETAQELGYRAATTAIGATIIVEYQRKGDRKETQVTMVAAPETVARDNTVIKGPNPFAGATAANLSPAVADELGLPADATGVVVYKVEKPPAARFFKAGDVVLEVNGTKIDSVDTLNSTLADETNLWRVTINRGSRVLKLAIGG
jgi:S1-C subfamily serine protease